MSNETKHVAVCVCTYKRPELLRRLLKELAVQETGELFTYSVVVADHDRLGSAAAVVSDFTASSAMPVTYFVEPVQNICLARNRAIANATGDFIAFVDDDEFPDKEWLLMLY